ncbi:MAG TPA: hypothetical protein PKX32_01400, partial [Candidatus Saccharicenans sp.]|nr:hypothetical protein [Candidatus Saccharicenans sp.]
PGSILSRPVIRKETSSAVRTSWARVIKPWLNFGLAEKERIERPAPLAWSGLMEINLFLPHK